MSNKLLLALFVLLLTVPVWSATYYVDNTDGTASDSNAGTDPAEPWLTIGKCASTIVAADTCIIAGTGTYDERVSPVNSGTVGNIITYKAATDCVPGGNCPKVRGFTFSSDSYITVQGLELTNQSMSADTLWTFPITGGTQISILNNYIHNTTNQCVRIGSDATFVRVAGNTIKYCAEASTVYGVTPGPFAITTGVNDTLVFSVQGGAPQTITLTAGAARTTTQIRDEINAIISGALATIGATQKLNVWSNTLGPTSAIETQAVANDAYTTLGITVGAGTMAGMHAGVGAGSGTATSDILVENNVISHTADYFLPADGSRFVLRNNTLGPADSFINHHIDVVQFAVATKGLVEGNLSIDNSSSDNHFYLAQNEGGDHWIVRYNSTCRGQGGFDQRLADQLYLYNNTFYDNFAYMSGNNTTQAGPWTTSLSNFALNNIWYKSTNTTIQIYATPPGDGSLTKDYDIWYLTGDPSETNDVNADPLVVDPASCNFYLQSGSPAISAGGPLTTVHADDIGSGTSLVLTDAHWFQDGWAGVDADCISVGTVGNQTCITAIDYDTNIVTISPAITRSDGESVWLFTRSDGSAALWTSAPPIGAFPQTPGNYFPGLR